MSPALLNTHVYLIFSICGGETASTGILKHWLHTERLPARKNDRTLNIFADDYEYALAA